MTSRRRDGEFEVCNRLAAEINRLRGADYEAQRVESDPPDALLVSVSGRPSCPPIPVEVVSAPRTSDTVQIRREDRDDVLKTQTRLDRLLVAQGVLDADLTVALSGQTSPYQLTPSDLDRIVAFAAACRTPGSACVTGEEVEDLDRDMATRVRQVAVHRGPIIGRSTAWIPLGGSVPIDGRWIRGAVSEKADKYESATARSLTLAVDAGWAIDPWQVKAFIDESRGAGYPFQAIWILPRAGKVRLAWERPAG